MSFEINERIKKYRKEKKITKKTIAEALGMNYSTYCRMETEAKRIDIDTAEKIAAVLGVERDLIVYGEKLDFSPVKAQPLIAEDPENENPLGIKNIPIIHSYKCGDFEISVEEKIIINVFRSLSDEDKQKVRDLLNEIK